MIVLVALEHIYFLVLEMFCWTSPRGLKVFRMTLAQAESTKVVAANQGLYNGFLAAGLVWSLVHPSSGFGKELAIFFLVCVVVAACYGGYSVGRKILLVQGLPAAIALMAILLAPIL